MFKFVDIFVIGMVFEDEEILWILFDGLFVDDYDDFFLVFEVVVGSLSKC